VVGRRIGVHRRLRIHPDRGQHHVTEGVGSVELRWQDQVNEVGGIGAIVVLVPRRPPAAAYAYRQTP
jgi:hypothetical protein